ncbi:MAG: hypothetical protein ACI4F1_05145 [Bariatricus sp.]
MMNLLKKHLALLLAVILCLSLVACGGSDEPVEPVGDDWRSSGVVVGSGTITHEGEGSVHVLVTVDENSAAFYRDEAEQILFDSVSFPMTIPDAQEYFDGISFDDINGDGESDVSVGFVYGPGDSTSLIWIWDPEERYVFQEDLSVLTTNSGGISDYVGLWEYVGEDLWVRICEDETWELINDEGRGFTAGTVVSVDSTSITLYYEETGDVIYFERTASGDLIDSENDGMLVPAYDVQFEDDSYEGLRGDASGLSKDDYSVYQGVWLCDTDSQFDFIDINAEGDWEIYSNGDVIDEGYFWYIPEDDVTYVYSHVDEDVDDGYVELDGAQLYISTIGSFHCLGRSISELEGVWCLDNRLFAETYIIIDSSGFWEYYQCTSGDTESTEVDTGTFTYDMDVGGIYYANSMYDFDTSYRVDCIDDGILVWGDEGTFYWGGLE